METAKVDIRKLQLLNDRINQCIDALNQVRLSVHGLTPSSTGPGAAFGFGGAQLPFGAQQGIGLSHSGGIGSPFGATGSPGLNPQFGPFGQSPAMGNPFFPQGIPGLSHTSAPWTQGTGFPPGISPYGAIGYGNEALQDPLLTVRINQTFPYAQFPVPPVVSLY